MISVSKATSNASFDASPASSTQTPDKPVDGTSTRTKNTIPGLPSRAARAAADIRPRGDGSKLRSPNRLNGSGEASAHRQPNGAPYDVIRYLEPGTGHSSEVVGVKTAGGGFDVKNPATGETIGRLAVVDSRQADGTVGERVGVDPRHAKLPGGMHSWGGGQHRISMQTAYAGSSAGPGAAALHTQQPPPVAQPWYVGNRQIAAHVPPLTTQNLTQFDRNQLHLALNPGNRSVVNFTATSGANGIMTHQFQVEMGPRLQPLGVTATLHNGVLSEIKLNPSKKRFQFAAQAPMAAPQQPVFVSRRRQVPLAARHAPLTSLDTFEYRQLERQYSRLFNSGAIRHAPETQSFLFDNVYDVGMDDPQVIRQSEGTMIATDGLGPCIAICARGFDWAGQSVLGMYHYSGAGESPTGAMETMQQMMQKQGATNISYSLIGGMITPREQESGSLDYEREFLSLSGRFPIEGVRLHVSEGEHDAMGIENSVGVVLSSDGAVYRSEALYPYSL